MINQPKSQKNILSVELVKNAWLCISLLDHPISTQKAWKGRDILTAL